MPCSVEGCSFPNEGWATYDDVSYCMLHYPIEGKREWTEQQKSDFHELVKKHLERKGRLKGGSITGQLELDLKRDRVANNRLKITRTEFHDQLKISEGRTIQIELGDVQFLGELRIVSGQQQAISVTDTSFAKSTVIQSGSGSSVTIKRSKATAPFRLTCQKGECLVEKSRFHDQFHFYLLDSNSSIESVAFLGSFLMTSNSAAKEIGFTAVNWGSDAKFDSVIVQEDLKFENCYFKGPVSFKHCHFKSNVDFGDTIFYDRSSFESAEFSSETQFSECTFYQAPKFHDAKIHEDTTFPDQNKFLDTKSALAANAYRTLKHQMEGKKARNDEGLFFALEQKSRRALKNVSRTEKFFSWFYEQTSNYGQDILKPIRLFLLLLALFFLLYWWTLGAQWCFDCLSQVFTFTVQQSVRPFSAWLPRGEAYLQEVAPEASILPVQLIATIQAFLTTGLLAILLVTIRWKFRRG